MTDSAVLAAVPLCRDSMSAPLSSVFCS